MPTQQLGPFCQSCAMPLTKPDDFGTDVTGYRINDYCHYCFADGAFTAPQATMQGMIDKTVDVMVRKGIMPGPQARVLMSGMIPRLKRWRDVSLGAGVV
jgi:Putative zinc ribbon domain